MRNFLKFLSTKGNSLIEESIKTANAWHKMCKTIYTCKRMQGRLMSRHNLHKTA